MPSDYPADLDALGLPDWDGALGQPARTAQSFLTDIVDSVKAVQASLGTTDDPGPILVQGGLVFNVKDFGALGNGVADDTGPVQAALTAAAGKELVFPPGTYLLSSAVIIPACASMTLTGSPGASIIKAHASKSLTAELLKTTITGAPTRTVKNLTIRGLVFDGANLAPERWLQNPATGATISNPEADYYDAGTNPSGKIGNPAFPTYDVMDLVTDNRRNGGYDTQASLVRLSLTEDTLVEKCIFRNHFGMGLTEAGGRNVTIQNNVFVNVGKDDGPYQAIWTQSHGTPDVGFAEFQDSENIQILYNTFRDLERGAMIFAPTKGGKVIGNKIFNTGELGIYIPDNINIHGASSEIAGNTIRTVRITDIVANGIECGVVSDLWIHHNHIEDTDDSAMHLTGVKRTIVESNFTKDCYRTHTIKYGPFSERYSFNVGAAPIAGESRPVGEGRVFGIGTLAGVGCENLTIRGNIIRETRGTFPSVFKQLKTAADNAAKLTVIENNMLEVPSGMQFLDATIGNVWDTNIPLHIRNNSGHSSEAAYVDVFSATTTGVHAVTCGFRPRVVRVYAAAATATLGMACHGVLTWQADGTEIFFNERLTSVTGTNQQFAIGATNVLRLVDASNTLTFSLSFVAWDEVGVSFNVGACSQTTDVRIVCET